MAAVTVYSAPDDGRKGRPKHAEHTCSCYAVFDPQTARSVLNICNLCPSYMFRLLQDYYQGIIHEGIKIEQILSKMCMWR